MKNGIADLGMKSPLYLPGPVEPHYGPGRYLTFEGFSVDQHGKRNQPFSFFFPLLDSAVLSLPKSVSSSRLLLFTGNIILIR
jgi:hypothetical protein